MALAKWRTGIIQDLGGDVSTQQSAIIDLAVEVRSSWVIDSVDAWILNEPTLISYQAPRKLSCPSRAAAPAISRWFGALSFQACGLERKGVKVKTLEQNP